MSSLIDQLAEVVGKQDDGNGAVPYWLPTSLPNVNMALSGRRDRGFAGGRIITIAGPESCGKTAIATEIIAQGQRQGGFGFMQDFEHAWMLEHAKTLGLNPDFFYYKKPRVAEEGFELSYRIIETLRQNQVGIKAGTKAGEPEKARAQLWAKLRGIDLATLPPIVGLMDSIAAMIPAAQDISYDKQNMKTKNMEHAMLLSIELKRLARDAEESGTTMVLLNQLRTNPGIMFGDNSTEPGGNAPRFYASQMLRLRRVDKWYAAFDDKKSEIIGDVVELFVRKNKVYRPFKKTKYVFRTAGPVGLDVIGTMILLGKEGGVLGPTGGTTLNFDGKRYAVAEFDALCRKDEAIKAKFIDFVMGAIDPVSEGPVIEEEPGAFSLAGLPPAD